MNVMKKILPYLLLLAGLPAFAQKNTTLKIKITTDFSRRHHFGSLNPDTIKFYKMPGNELAFTVSAEKIRDSIKLTHIPVGTYRVTYRRNLFMDTAIRQVTLMKKPVNEISLCVDSLDSYPQNTLARLQDKDSVLINYHAVSCDGPETAKLIITRDKDHFVARMYSLFVAHTRLLDSTYQPKETFRSVTLTDQQIQAFVRFENELLQIKPFIETSYEENKVTIIRERISTTNESYAVKSKYFNIELEDKWSQWAGFYWLSAAFFGRPY